MNNVVNPIPVIISSVGLDEGALENLSQAVEFIGSKGIACRFVGNDSTEGHLIVVDGDSELGQNALVKLRPGQVKLVFSEDRVVGKNTVSLAKPIKSTVLNTVLERVCNQLEMHLAAIAAKSQMGESNDTEERVRQTVFHVLYDAKCAQKTIKVQVNGYPSILVNGLGNSLATEASQDELRGILAAPKDATNVEEVSIVDFPTVPTDVVKLSPLDNSIWAAGLLWRSGRTLAGCAVDQPVKLKAWPNFTRNNFFPEHLKLSAALAVQALSINKLHETTQIPMDEIICYFNAAYAVGLIDVEPNQAAAPPPPPSRAKVVDANRQGLLSKLAHRFGLG